jgi:membrane-bound serine protease (ClpP class)
LGERNLNIKAIIKSGRIVEKYFEEMAVEIPTFFTDPNIVYITLWLGLWIVVTATHAPGTGFLEGAALLVLGGTALILLSLPTNWWAVLLFAAGVVGFIIIPFLKQQYTTLSLGGLILQAIGGYFLFSTMSVSPLVIGATIAVSLLYHYFVLLPGFRQIKQYKHEDRDAMLIGMEGRVMKALDPVGTVQVNSELWTAASNQNLPSGTRVVVLERNGLQIYVEPVKDKRLPTEESFDQSITTSNGVH